MKIIQIIFLSLLSLTIYAQNENYYNPEYKHTDKKSKANKSIVFKQKPQTRINIGSSYSNWGNGASVFTNYIAPSVNFQVSSKLQLTTGITVANHFVDGFYAPYAENTNTLNGNFTDVCLFGGAEYQFSDRLKVSGSVVYKVANPYEAISSSSSSNDYIMSLRSEFEIVNGLSIGVEVSTQQGTRMNRNGFNQGFYYPGYYTGANRFMNR